MINNRLWVIGSMLLAVAILAVGYVVGISPLLATAAQADADRATVEQQNTQQTTTLAALKEQYAGIAEIRSSLAEKQKSIPSSANYASFLGELDGAEQATGAVITDITVSDAIAYTVPVDTSTPEPAPAATTEATASADSASTTETPAADVSPPADPTTLAAPIPGVELLSTGNFVLIPISVSVTGDLDQMMAFVESLQSGDDRLVSVSTLSFAQDDNTGAYTGEFGGFVFVLTDTTAAVGSTTTAGVEASTTGIG